MQAYTPSLYNLIGQQISNFVDSIISAPTVPVLGNIIHQGAGLFQIEPVTYDSFAYFGGDYGIAIEWAGLDGGDRCGPEGYCDTAI